MTRVKAIERIRKLLALAGDSPEGRVAMQRARELQAEYDIGADELDATEDEHTTISVVDVKWLEHWRIMLIMFLSQEVGVRLDRFIGPGKRYVRLTLIGTRGLCLDVLYAYDHFEGIVWQMARRMESDGQAQDYARGMVMSIAERWKEYQKRRKMRVKKKKSDGFHLTWTPASEMQAEVPPELTIKIPAFRYKSAFNDGLEAGMYVAMPRPRKVKKKRKRSRKKVLRLTRVGYADVICLAHGETDCRVCRPDA